MNRTSPSRKKSEPKKKSPSRKKSEPKKKSPSRKKSVPKKKSPSRKKSVHSPVVMPLSSPVTTRKATPDMGALSFAGQLEKLGIGRHHATLTENSVETLVDLRMLSVGDLFFLPSLEELGFSTAERARVADWVSGAAPSKKRSSSKKRAAARPVAEDGGLRTIYGPVSFHYFEFVAGGSTKKILMLGDVHTRLTQFIPNLDTASRYYDEFLVDIIHQAKKRGNCIDFYLEKWLTRAQGNLLRDFVGGSTYHHNLRNSDHLQLKHNKFYYDIQNDFSTLNYMREVLEECSVKSYTDPDVDSCRISRDTIDYDNLRVHNFDLRQFNSSNNLFKYIDTYLGEDRTETITLADFIMCYIADISYADDGVLVTLQDIRDELVRAELNTADGPILNERFVRSLEQVKDTIDKETQKFIKNGILPHVFRERGGEDLKKVIYDQIHESTDSMGLDMPNYIKVSLLLTDIYLLLRLFKNFDRKDRGPRLCRTADAQNKIIIFAGDLHIENYTAVMETLFPGSLKFSIRKEGDDYENYTKILDFDRADINTGHFANFDEVARRFYQ